MNQLSANFHRKFDSFLQQDPCVTKTPEYQEALLYALLGETSCFRYWEKKLGVIMPVNFIIVVKN